LKHQIFNLKIDNQLLLMLISWKRIIQWTRMRCPKSKKEFQKKRKLTITKKQTDAVKTPSFFQYLTCWLCTLFSFLLVSHDIIITGLRHCVVSLRHRYCISNYFIWLLISFISNFRKSCFCFELAITKNFFFNNH